GLHAEAEEAEEGLQQHYAGDGQGGVDDHWPQGVGDQVLADDAPAGQAQGLRRLDEFLAPQVLHLTPHDAGHGEPFHRADGEKQQDDVAAEHHHQQDDEDHEGQGVEDIHQAHHHRVELAPGVARHRAPQHADDEGHAGGDETHHQ